MNGGSNGARGRVPHYPQALLVMENRAPDCQSDFADFIESTTEVLAAAGASEAEVRAFYNAALLAMGQGALAVARQWMTVEVAGVEPEPPGADDSPKRVWVEPPGQNSKPGARDWAPNPTVCQGGEPWVEYVRLDLAATVLPESAIEALDAMHKAIKQFLDTRVVPVAALKAASEKIKVAQAEMKRRK